MQAEDLTAEFGIAGVLDFVETEHGLVKATISLDGISGELYLQGAHLATWQPPGERPVLFTSPNSAFAPGTAIRGGIPIIFPWFAQPPRASGAAAWVRAYRTMASRRGRNHRPRVADPDLQSRRRRCRLAVLAGAVSRNLHRGLRANPVVAARRAKPGDASDHL